MRKITAFLMLAGFYVQPVVAYDCPPERPKGVSKSDYAIRCSLEAQRLADEAYKASMDDLFAKKDQANKEYAIKHGIDYEAIQAEVAEMRNATQPSYSDYQKSRNFVDREIKKQESQDFFVYRPRR